MNDKRLARLVTTAGQADLDLVCVMPGPNFRYLTGIGMEASERSTLLLIPTRGGTPVIVCPRLESDKIAAASGAGQVFPWSDEEGPLPALHSAFDHLRQSGVLACDASPRLGLEYRYCRLQERELLASVLDGLRYADAGPLLAELRMRKDDVEVALMERAASYLDIGMQAAHEAVRPGVRESDIADHLAAAIRRAGGPQPDHTLIASGPRSGLPHAETSERVVGEGELVWVDCVLFVDGYCADITRTFASGRLDAELDRIYSVVLEAQAYAREMAGPGKSGEQIDQAARSIIEQAGYGASFTHRTGHGLGLEVHEEPYMVRGSRMPLEPGMTFTIEPGVYLPDRGGVRIEDDILITADGSRSLTGYPRDTRRK